MSIKLDNLFKDSERKKIDEHSKFVIMSDHHRGAGDNYDNFMKNQNIFEAALLYYYHKGFTYIELGDGDEMWEVNNYQDIIAEHLDAFKSLQKFHKENRLLMIYGNHDMTKKNPEILEKYFYQYYDRVSKKKEDLLPNLKVYESYVLEYQNHDIFLVHGHQVDFLNSNLWKLSRFLVRHVWRNLERIGTKDPTSAAKNYHVSNSVEKKLKNWSAKNDTILIAGHTHRPIFPIKGESLYFNDGSCVHPNGITCIEIEEGNITLVKWSFKVDKGEFLTAKREIIDGSDPLTHFFKREI